MASDSIDLVLKRGAVGGLVSLSRSERKVWLISEAEVLCDMEGIDSFLDRHESFLPETADAFAEAGAVQIADGLRAIHAQLPGRSDELLDRVNALVTARTGYNHDSVAGLLDNAA